MSLVLLGLFALFLVLGLPVALAIGGATLISMQAGGVPLLVLPQQMFSGINSFALVAVPMFILAGDIMAQGQVSARLIALADALIGFLKGGLSIVSILAAVFFAAISGSGAATTAAVSATLVPELTRKGYDPASAASLIAAGGTIGVVIPPSVPMIIYAVIAQESVSKLFLSGFIPGVAMAIGLMAIALIQGHRRAYPSGGAVSVTRIFRTFLSAFWGLMTPVIILGGIFSGVFTPSEAAVIAVNYALFVSLVIYRDMRASDVYRLFIRSAMTTAVIMFVISASAALSWLLSNWQVPAQIAGAVLSLSSNTFVILTLMLLLILLTGVFIETASALIILTPILLPLALQLGLDPVHFGIVIVMGLAIGMITPPVAINLYVATSVTGLGLEQISKAVLPYMAVLIVVLFLVTFAPLAF
ncbi:TRAP transporter large permease [Tropicimonas sp. IMCC34043]|uniref:TRAP transporter large permease n=1 Tax=Tropicimonas sp. IMCC34043 TaxID=2248760 RepID=UPI000E25E22B|nr:TRAP transporter large permease [Tropicimonas sp. IMCC34043]